MPFFTNTTTSKTSKKASTTSSASVRNNKSSATTNTTIAPNTNRDMVTDAKPTTPLELSTSSNKDVREFEHGRQKAKKTARTQVWRDDKVRSQRIKAGLLPSPAPTAHAKRTRSGGFQVPNVRPDWEEGWSVEDTEEEWMREFVDDGEAGTKIVRSESGSLEVDLTNLMKPAKARKTKRAVGDFEVLPSVRQVVVLDDRLDGELEAEEPWEHLSIDGEDEKGFSYAEVAATGAC